jgi:hypothetical protein
MQWVISRLNARGQRFLINAALGICFVLLLSHSESALGTGPVFSGLLQYGVSSSGQNAGSPIWTTLGNQTNFAILYVTAPNAGDTAPFLNHGDGNEASISYQLSPGTYQFYFFNDPFASNTDGYYGLNLFFDGNNTNPGISVFSPEASDNPNPVPSGFTTLSLDGDNSNQVPSPGTLTLTGDGMNITLTDYAFSLPGDPGNPGLDRVGNEDDVPDGDTDGTGFFDLTVTPAPEPSCLGLTVVVIACVLGSRRRKRLFRRLIKG